MAALDAPPFNGRKAWRFIRSTGKQRLTLVAIDAQRRGSLTETWRLQAKLLNEQNERS